MEDSKNVVFTFRCKILLYEYVVGGGVGGGTNSPLTITLFSS
jgi:hypothetical protein